MIQRSLLFIGVALTAITGASAAQTLKPTWKADAPAGARRIAIAEFKEVTKPRVVFATESGLSVHVPGDARLESEWTTKLDKEATFLFAGRFAKGKPSAIVFPGGFVFRDGEKYVQKAAEIGQINGKTRFTDDDENLFLFEGMGEPASWQVDPTAEKPLSPGRNLPDPENESGGYAFIMARLPVEVLGQFGLPEEAQKTGVLGFIGIKTEPKLLLFVPWTGKDESYLALTSMDESGRNGTQFKPKLRSPKLAGPILDIAVGPDPLTGKGIGFYVLESTGADNKGRIVEYIPTEPK